MPTTPEEAQALELRREQFLAKGRVASVGRGQMRVWSLPGYLPNEGDWFLPFRVPLNTGGHGWIKQEVTPVEVLSKLQESQELVRDITKSLTQDAAAVQSFCAILMLALGQEKNAT
jgi:hypothetical protein